MIAGMECDAKGNNARHLVTKLTTEPQALYDDVDCQRGEAENQIKEAQVGLFATRTGYSHTSTQLAR